MKNKIVFKFSLLFIASISLVSACGSRGFYANNMVSSLSSQSYDEYDFGDWTKQLANSGPAKCNRFSVTSGSTQMITGQAQHPTDPTYGDTVQGQLVVKINSIDPRWFNDSNDRLWFVPIQESSMGSIRGAPLMATVKSPYSNYQQVLTPSLLSQLATSGPLLILLHGTSNEWNVLSVVVSTTGETKEAKFLIPNFESNPNLYQKDPEVTSALLKLHPFYPTYLNQNLDFERKAATFCFSY